MIVDIWYVQQNARLYGNINLSIANRLDSYGSATRHILVLDKGRYAKFFPLMRYVRLFWIHMLFLILLFFYFNLMIFAISFKMLNCSNWSLLALSKSLLGTSKKGYGCRESDWPGFFHACSLCRLGIYGDATVQCCFVRAEIRVEIANYLCFFNRA